ncbi:uncharacterized protein LOC132064212 [Lycium ferocissimum]|uniref:uncharacterized protein LOC132064212 n=1 Tax=Lycium ferocissimum TaxID=112874 RepID=UPI002814B1FD|nr:uncharacterized protein LOC132064212 [Lycium ferocissimum]
MEADMAAVKVAMMEFARPSMEARSSSGLCEYGCSRPDDERLYGCQTRMGDAMVRIRDTPVWWMYMRLSPPIFMGAPDEDAYEFIVITQELLHAAGIMETFGVRYVTLRFNGGARSWWRDYLASRPACACPFTWDQLYGVFLERYLPRPRRDERQCQFLDLRQEGMPVATYALSFSYLARYSYPLISMEFGRIRWFISGLDGPLQLLYIQLEVERASFQTIVDSAVRVEAMKPRAASSGSSVSVFQHSTPLTCFSCGVVGHVSRRCP